MKWSRALMTITTIMFVYGDVDMWPSVEEDHTKLQIVVPNSLSIQGGYQHRDALFGLPDYTTGSLQTQLIHAHSTACSALNASAWIPPFALLVDRGGCHFVEKVRHAQHAGARAVLIADHTCLCMDTECMRTTGDESCESILPFMADDESGGDISIPSMLIRKSDARKIQDYIKNDHGESNVMVQFDWGIPSPDGRVEWTLWHSAWDEQSMGALQDLALMVEKLGNRAYFTPHFVSYNGSKVGCTSSSSSQDSTNPCGNMCLNAGRYCLLDPSPFHEQQAGASGADVVVENLRRACIWQIVSKTDPGIGSQWWKYVSQFAAACNQDETHFKDPDCPLSLMKSLNIPSSQVEACMHPYGPNINENNAILAQELNNQTHLQLLRLPAVYVDGVHARGSISASSIFTMICAGYGLHDPPAVCDCAHASSLDLMACVSAGSYQAYTASQRTTNLDTKTGVSFGIASSLIVMVVIILGGVGMAQYRRSQRHMRDQVRSILAEYMPLEDDSEDLECLHPAVLASVKSPRGFLPSRTSMDEDNDGV